MTSAIGGEADIPAMQADFRRLVALLGHLLVGECLSLAPNRYFERSDERPFSS
jgi:hypothetical protein